MECSSNLIYDESSSKLNGPKAVQIMIKKYLWISLKHVLMKSIIKKRALQISWKLLLWNLDLLIIKLLDEGLKVKRRSNSNVLYGRETRKGLMRRLIAIFFRGRRDVQFLADDRHWAKLGPGALSQGQFDRLDLLRDIRSQVNVPREIKTESVLTYQIVNSRGFRWRLKSLAKNADQPLNERL